MGNPIEERKEKIKPKKLYSVIGIIFDDGTTSGYGVEYTDMGRLKNQKMISPTKEDFIASVRTVVPSAIPAIEKLLDLVYGDLSDNESGHEKTASVTVDIYSDGFVSTDFGEFVKGARGPAKCWRLTPHDFIGSVNARLGRLSESFKPLLTTGSASDVMTTATSEIIDED